ncbi:diaminopropionate ammonia-lyase [Entomomonas moraniae]|uniref:Diaminopropionate ammonia-lyase n=1 Tax=Entomomonas moraniae TaxID=2213226 RepID=A0A3S9XBU9_9GAMM|nr:diaminopropionate ammonia-lyase [Entomomonas moraniae]AZS49890.1 diaminopropionate ammonia-lyase [Entomomonas moraniae]
MTNETAVFKFNPRKKPYGKGTDLSLLNDQAAKVVKGFHSKFPAYAITPLVSLPNLSKYLGIGSLHVKDESKRFKLNAFKVLGGAYAIGQYLANKLNREINTLSFAELASPEVKAQLGDITFVTATDGNHGRGVAWAAEQLGQKAVVFMPKGSSLVRAQNIRNHGAECTITELNYDDSVRLAYKNAQEKNWVMVQDTAWDGYEDIPTWIMQGYMTLAVEAMLQLEQAKAPLPTHVFLQAGVGSFAGAALGYIVEKMKEKSPTIVIMEPNQADCLYKSALADDGNPHNVTGAMQTLMAGLACGEPNTISWPIIRDNTDCFISTPDYFAADGMRILAAPLRGDSAIVSGESGAIGTGLLYHIMKEPKYQGLKEQLKLDQTAHVLLVSTEGNTSPDIYEDVVWLGRQQL